MYNYSNSNILESMYVYCNIEKISVLFSVQSGFIAGVGLDCRLPIVTCELVSFYSIKRSDSKNKDIFCVLKRNNLAGKKNAPVRVKENQQYFFKVLEVPCTLNIISMSFSHILQANGVRVKTSKYSIIE